MFDWVPLRGWLLIGIAVAAYGPSLYILRHIAHAPSRRDITRPPEDLSWRTTAQFARSLLLLLALALFALFIFSPAAVQLTRSSWFWPALIGGVGIWALSTVASGFFSGTIEPLVRGLRTTYDRSGQPARFWASMAWNATLGCLLIWFAFQDQGSMANSIAAAQCRDSKEPGSQQEAVRACTELIEKNDLASNSYRASLMAARGIAYHELGATGMLWPTMRMPFDWIPRTTARITTED